MLACNRKRRMSDKVPHASDKFKIAIERGNWHKVGNLQYFTVNVDVKNVNNDSLSYVWLLSELNTPGFLIDTPVVVTRQLLQSDRFGFVNEHLGPGQSRKYIVDVLPTADTQDKVKFRLGLPWFKSTNEWLQYTSNNNQKNVPVIWSNQLTL